MSKTSEKQLPEKKSNTRKKLKYVGRETYINARTGEIETFAVEGIEERDFNFTKVWFEHLLASYDLIGNQKTKVANYIISNLNRENQLICSYRKIAEETGTQYIDTFAAIIGDDGEAKKELMQNDGLHPNEEGLKAILEYIRTHAYVT